MRSLKNTEYCSTGGTSCPWVGLTHGLSWVGSTAAKVLKIGKDYVNAFKAWLDKIRQYQTVSSTVSCIDSGGVWFKFFHL